MYRFQSLRAPELSDENQKEWRFINHPTLSGVLFTAVNGREDEQSKWEAMINVLGNLSGIFQSEEEAKNFNQAFYQKSVWLMKNRKKRNLQFLYDNLQGIQPLTNANGEILWNNLFFQVLLQNNFYIKEIVMQMLLLNHVAKHLLNSTEEEAKAKLPKLMQARVVLPLLLFDESTENQPPLTLLSNTTAISFNQNVEQTRQVISSKTKITQLNVIEKEIKKLEIKFKNAENKAYALASQEHQIEVESIVNDYFKRYDAEKRRLCAENTDVNYNPTDFCNTPDLEFPELPKFKYEPNPEIVERDLLKSLSQEANFYLQELLSLEGVETYNDLFEQINEKQVKLEKTILENTNFKEDTYLVGDTIIQKNANAQSLIGFDLCIALLFDETVSVTILIYEVNHLLQANNGIIYHLTMATGNNSNGYFNQYLHNGNLVIHGLFNNSLALQQYLNATGFTADLTFANGSKYRLNCGLNANPRGECVKGALIKPSDNATTIAKPSPFIPKGFGYRQLGIADHKKVVTEVCCYEAGEVAHIENVMASELRSKTTTKTYRSEVTETESTEIEKENLSDVISTERFEMQTEVAKLLQEQRQITAHSNFNSSWGSSITGQYALDVGGGYASNVSKEESNRQAVSEAKELTQRAVERIVTKVRKEKTVKIINEFVEENTHAFDNRGSSEHISGVFRFINAIYKNQIYNYGKRLMYEFMVPDPSQLHRLGMSAVNDILQTQTYQKPVDPRIAFPSFTNINQNNYRDLVTTYQAFEANACPLFKVYVGKSFVNGENGRDKPFVKNDIIPIPENYKSTKAKVLSSGSPQGPEPGQWPYFAKIHVGSNEIPSTSSNFVPIDNCSDEIHVSIGTHSFHIVNISITIECELSPVAYTKWQKETYEAIIKGYERQLELYNQSISQAKSNGIQMLDTNPGFYQMFVEQVLRKNCISYLIDNSTNSPRRFGRNFNNANPTFMNHQIDVSQEMDDYTSFAKFMEQAFEWNIMSYNFYPFYWADHQEWKNLYQFDTNSPLFRSFMQAGMARVVVTVRPGWEEAVMHYMATGQIWLGGQLPVLGSNLYLSIVDELQEQEYIVEDTWKTTLPTHLVALQRNGVALNIDGLPCHCPVLDPASDTQTEPLFEANANILVAKKE